MSNTPSGITINNNSDVGITCTYCGSSFTGQARYSDEVMRMFVDHFRRLHDATEDTDS